MKKSTILIIAAMVALLSPVIYGANKAQQVCSYGYGSNTIATVMERISLNPISQFVFDLQCEEINRGF